MTNMLILIQHDFSNQEWDFNGTNQLEVNISYPKYKLDFSDSSRSRLQRFICMKLFLGK